jgi:hypothetical protein
MMTLTRSVMPVDGVTPSKISGHVSRQDSAHVSSRVAESGSLVESPITATEQDAGAGVIGSTGGSMTTSSRPFPITAHVPGLRSNDVNAGQHLRACRRGRPRIGRRRALGLDGRAAVPTKGRRRRERKEGRRTPAFVARPERIGTVAMRRIHSRRKLGARTALRRQRPRRRGRVLAVGSYVKQMVVGTLLGSRSR